MYDITYLARGTLKNAKYTAISFPKAFPAFLMCESSAQIHGSAYIGMFQYGSEFKTHMDAKFSSIRGYCGDAFTSWIWFDIDFSEVRGGLPAALDACRRLVEYLISQGVPSACLLIFFSGSKGFHVGIPSNMWNPKPSPIFHKYVRGFCSSIAEAAGACIDTGVYSRLRSLRAPNTIHPKTELRKRPFDVEEILSLQLDGIQDLARKPRPKELPVFDGQPIPTFVSLWEKAVKDADVLPVRSVAGNRLHFSGPRKIFASTLEFVRFGEEKGARNISLFNAACNLLECGVPPEVVIDLLTIPALDSEYSLDKIHNTFQSAIRRFDNA